MHRCCGFRKASACQRSRSCSKRNHEPQAPNHEPEEPTQCPRCGNRNPKYANGVCDRCQDYARKHGGRQLPPVYRQAGRSLATQPVSQEALLPCANMRFAMNWSDRLLYVHAPSSAMCSVGRRVHMKTFIAVGNCRMFCLELRSSCVRTPCSCRLVSTSTRRVAVRQQRPHPARRQSVAGEFGWCFPTAVECRRGQSDRRQPSAGRSAGAGSNRG